MIPPICKLTKEELKKRDLSEWGYFRFGAPPADGRSVNHDTGEKEIGISVYEGWIYEDDNGELVLVINPQGIDVWDIDSVISPNPENWDVWELNGWEIGKSESGAPLVELMDPTEVKHWGKVDRVEMLNW